MTFMQWLLKEAIWYTIILVFFVWMGLIKTQASMGALAMGWFTMSLLMYVVRSKPEDQK
jgi:hypothetical protein